MIGKDWIEYFEKQPTPQLKKIHDGLTAIFSDSLLKKVYGYEEGLGTIQYFIERIIDQRGRKTGTQRKIMVGSFGANKDKR